MKYTLNFFLHILSVRRHWGVLLLRMGYRCLLFARRLWGMLLHRVGYLCLLSVRKLWGVLLLPPIRNGLQILPFMGPCWSSSGGGRSSWCFVWLATGEGGLASRKSKTYMKLSNLTCNILVTGWNCSCNHLTPPPPPHTKWFPYGKSMCSTTSGDSVLL